MAAFARPSGSKDKIQTGKYFGMVDKQFVANKQNGQTGERKISIKQTDRSTHFRKF